MSFLKKRQRTIVMKSYSQLGEDVYCFQNFMNYPRHDVVLVEVGAYDGLTYSNTFALEQFHNCRCVLIEPSPTNVRKVYQNRPKASIHRLAIMSNFGVCEFLGDAPISGVRTELTAEYIKAWDLEQAPCYNVLCAPLRAVTDAENLEHIDFLSIDVQGAEYLVLSSMNWRIPTGVICIELEGERAGQDEVCRTLLKDQGFEFKCRLHISEFWFKPNYFRASLLFDPNKKAHRFESFDYQFFTAGWQASLRGKFY